MHRGDVPRRDSMAEFTNLEAQIAAISINDSF